MVNPTEMSADTVFHYSIPALDEIGDGRLEPPADIGSGKLLLSGGEVLISKLNPRLPRVLLAKAHDVPTLASTEFIALRPGANVDERFLRYWLGSEPLRQMLNGATMSVTRSQQRVRPEIVTKSWLRVPSIGEQRAIADYLDAETARIDALIEKKQRMVELLEERWRQLITAAVTGVFELPADGELLTEEREGQPRPLRAIADIVLGRQRAPQYESGPHMTRYLRAANVKDGQLDLSDVKEMNFPPSDQTIFSLRRGDVLVSEGAGSLAAVGASATWMEELGGVVCFQNTLLLLRPKPPHDAQFLAWWCRHAYASGLFASIADGANIFHLSAERLKTVRLWVPTPSVQRFISKYLHSHETQQRRLVELCNQQIELLREHRQALITAAVTGQLPVSGVAA